MSRRESHAMNRIVHITPHFAVTGALQPSDFAQAAALGFKSIVSNLPDGESQVHPPSQQEAQLAAAAGLGFGHIPVTKAEAFSDRVVEGMTKALRELEGPVLAHCASGLRSAIAWAAAAARGQPVDAVLEKLAAAGFNLEPIRQDLEEQHDPEHSGDIPRTLDVGGV
jgi:sulfide:quinone oxidoreductase